MNNDEKLTILNALTVKLDQLVDLQGYLQRQGCRAEADLLEVWIDKLTQAVDQLRSGVLADWTGDANATAAKIGQLNDQIQTYIDEIKQDVQKAQDVVKVVGYIDQGIQTVLSLIK